MSNLVDQFNSIIKKQDNHINSIFSYYQKRFKKSKPNHVTKEAEKQLINDDKMLYQNWRTIIEKYKTDILAIVKANNQTQTMSNTVNNSNSNENTDLATINNDPVITLYNQTMNNFLFIKKILEIITNKDQNLKKSFVLNLEDNSQVIDTLFKILFIINEPKKDFNDRDHNIINVFLKHGLNQHLKDKFVNFILLYAAKNGHDQTVKYLVEKGADPNKADEFGITALILAAKNGHEKIVKYLIEKGTDPNQTDEFGNTALIITYLHKQDTILKYLLTQPHINLNIKAKNGNSIWMLAIADWRVPIIELLLDAGVDINGKDLNGHSALMIVTIERNNDKINYLLQKGADPNLCDKNNNTALMFATEKSAKIAKLSSNNKTSVILDLEEQDLTIIKLLFNDKNNINVKNKNDDTSLTLAIKDERLKIFNYLLENGANPHLRNKTKITTLMLAADIGNLAMFNKLHDQQVGLTATDESGNTALMIAAQNGHLAIVKRIVALLMKLNFKIHINAQNNNGYTALILAATTGHDQTVNYLLQMGANPYIGDNYQVIPLITAIHNGHASVIQSLLAFDKDKNNYSIAILNFALIQAIKNSHVSSLLPFTTNTKNNSYSTTLTTTNLIQTVKNKHLAIVEMLIDAGANINSKDNDGLSTLMWAVTVNNFKMVQYLVKEKKLDLNKTDNDGHSALIYAINQDNFQISQFLLNNDADLTITDNFGKNAFAIAKERRQIIIKAKIINQDQKIINHKIIELLRKKHHLLNSKNNTKTNEVNDHTEHTNNWITTSPVLKSGKGDYLHFKTNSSKSKQSANYASHQQNASVKTDNKKENTKVTGTIAKKPHQTDQQNLFVIAAEKQIINKKAIKDSQIQAQLQIERAKQHEKLIKIQQELAKENIKKLDRLEHNTTVIEDKTTVETLTTPHIKAIEPAIKEVIESNAKAAQIANGMDSDIVIVKRLDEWDHPKGRPAIIVGGGINKKINKVLVLLGSHSQPPSYKGVINWYLELKLEGDNGRSTYFKEYAWITEMPNEKWNTNYKLSDNDKIKIAKHARLENLKILPVNTENTSAKINQNNRTRKFLF